MLIVIPRGYDYLQKNNLKLATPVKLCVLARRVLCA